MVDWIDQAFPNAVGRHNKTSDADDEYNCIAWAAEDASRWWSHEDGYYWPVDRDASVDSLIDAFRDIQYEICDSGKYEKGFEKVAIYAKDGEWTHAARQISGGEWTSKMGEEEDISHQQPEDLLRGTILDYGVIHCYMKRRRI